MATQAPLVGERAKGSAKGPAPASAVPVHDQPERTHFRGTGALPGNPWSIPAELDGGTSRPRPIEHLLGTRGVPLGVGDVHIHTGPAAAESAQSMRARAYTYGQDIVFNRGEFNPTTATGQTLLAHELAHTLRQHSPANYQLAFQKQNAAPDKFFKEVEDALKSPVSQDDRTYLQNLLALSKAIDTQNQADTRQLTAQVVAADPSSITPIARSDAFVNELVARAFLMGLNAEANQLRAFFRKLAARPMQRNPWDKKFGPDKDLWKKLVELTLAQAKFGNASDASASLDNLLATFHTIVGEAKKLNFEDVKRERALRYAQAIDDPFSVSDDTLDSYFSTLIYQLEQLTPSIFHSVQALMEAAISDLEADKGNAALNVVKDSIDNKILPAFKITIGDTNLLNLTMDATRSTFGPQGGKHLDYYDTSRAGEKRAVTINYYDKSQTFGVEKVNPVGYIVVARKKQIDFLEKFYVAGNRSAMGTSPLKLESVDDWRKFLHEKVVEERKNGKKDDEVFDIIVKFLSGYLQAFTTSTPFNIEDVVKSDAENYNKRQFPRDIAGRLIQDCGVFALRTVFMLSLVKSDLNLRIRFIFLPSHVGLIITGDGIKTHIAHNNLIYPIDPANLAKEQADWAKKDPTKPTDAKQFIGEVAGSYYSPGVNMPFRIEEAPTIPKNDPREKEKLQDFYTRNVKAGDVLTDDPKSGISQFHLRYLDINKKAKQEFNEVVVPTWNNALRNVWNQHKDKLLAELANARDKKANSYDAESKAYLADLDTALKPIHDAETALDQSRQDVSKTVADNPGLVAKSSTPGFGRRVSFSFQWQTSLDDHRKAVSDLSNLTDPAKAAQIVPPFADAKGFLEPMY